MRAARELLFWGYLALGALICATAIVPPSAAQPLRQQMKERPVDENGAIRRFSGALKFATISNNDPAAFNGAPFLELHAYFSAQFPHLHQTVSRETISNYGLLYRWQGSDASLAPLLFAAHIDVVPADSATLSQWTHPPFAGVVSDGFVWGRGALDDKASAVGVLEAAERLIASGFRPRRTVYFAFGHDEEVGGRSGAAVIVQQLKARGVRPAFVLDEGGAIYADTIKGLAKPAALIGVAEKGSVSVQLSAKNPGGFSYAPPPNSAVGILARAVVRLEAHPFSPRITAPVRAMYTHLAPHMATHGRGMLRDPSRESVLLRELTAEYETNAFVQTTTVATMFSGSPRPALLPEHATAAVNFRTLPGDTREMILEHVRKIIDDERVQVEVLPVSREPSSVSPTDNQAFKTISDAIRHVITEDIAVAPYLIFGATDARYYTAITPFVYRFQPQRLTVADRARMHGLNERLAVSNYLEIVRFYEHLIVSADKKPD